jgi:hypothetical protein
MVAELNNCRADVASWHRADIKLRPQLGRYGVESGLHWLVMSISAFDPKQTLAGFAEFGAVVLMWPIQTDRPGFY